MSPSSKPTIELPCRQLRTNGRAADASGSPAYRLLPAAYRLLPTALCLLVLLAGCPQTEPTGEETSGNNSLSGLTLRLLVVGDADLAGAAGQLQGEWTAQTGSELQVRSMSEQELATAERLETDAVICPSYQLGLLAERKLISPMPEELRQDDAGGWSETFELVRLSEVTWGSDTYAVPFGSPVLCCYYRADLLEEIGRKAPETWSEYQKLARLLADRENLGRHAPAEDAPWYGTIEPLGPGWAGRVLLARSAAYAKHRDHYSTLFEIETMEPLVDGPPLVRALEELAAAAKLGPAEQLQYDPAAVRTAFWEGRCGLALSWPTATAKRPKDLDENITCGLAELPGSRDVYNASRKTWETRLQTDDPHVPLLAIAGRIGVVAADSAHQEAAFALVFWLSADQLGQSSPATTLFRHRQAKSPRAWVEPQLSAAAAGRYAATLERTFRRQQWLFALRIPGRTDYLAALDDAVGRAVRGEQSPAEAMRQAAQQWRKITQRLGPESQRRAYLRSLELEPSGR